LTPIVCSSATQRRQSVTLDSAAISSAAIEWTGALGVDGGSSMHAVV